MEVEAYIPLEGNPNIGPEASSSSAQWPNKKVNFDEIYVTVPTTLDLSKHTTVRSLSSLLKPRRPAREKSTKQNLALSPQLKDLLQRIENDDDFNPSQLDIEDALRS